MSSAAPVVAQSAFQKFLNHPAGPKTIHFWAPAAKWDVAFYRAKLHAYTLFMRTGWQCALVGAGVGDLSRPAENLSLSQNVALAATGLIWSRYSLVIIPKNYSLFTVNVFVAATGLTQLYRIFDYHQGLKKTEEKLAAAE
ncbi:hypothetical protein KI688_002107 [Linnemannia hyalina]|uniref:Mitochondrial pyruvate carrier n=1 Tax=Linnemannia hyalina TaxID=64524 RepID=A0A9P7XR50_9FUNG|nr:hypothetical protein KI688_002107 [Linnemannia hyalina]